MLSLGRLRQDLGIVPRWVGCRWSGKEGNRSKRPPHCRQHRGQVGAALTKQEDGPGGSTLCSKRGKVVGYGVEVGEEVALLGVMLGMHVARLHDAHRGG